MQGYIYLHRKIIYSDIYTMPPLYLRVFERLVLEANHKDNEIPYKGSKKLIKRGERLTSIAQISEWVGWYERGVFKVPNKKTISVILDWLISNDLIQIYDKGNARETHYNIVKYDVYQQIESTKVTEKKRKMDTNNNDYISSSSRNDEMGINVIQKTYEENGFGLFAGFVVDEVISYMDDGCDWLVVEALKEAKVMNKVSWKYAKTCLNSWINAGIKTVGELEAYRQAFIERKGNKEIKKSVLQPVKSIYKDLSNYEP